MLNLQALKKLGAAAAMFTVALSAAQSTQAQALGTLRQAPYPAAENPGNLNMFYYEPVTPLTGSGRPLVVVLHGCGQTAAEYAEESGWMELAEARQFHVVFAEQKTVNHPGRCFNWYKSGDITRGSGEAKSIAGMVFKYHQLFPWSIYPTKVYATGLSAGGAMATVMAATYPDLFAGIATNAGVPYGCAKGFFQTGQCMMGPESSRSDAQWGDLVRQANPFGDNGRKPSVIIFQGTEDSTVTPPRLNEFVKQWTNYNRLSAVPTSSAPLKGYPSNVYSTPDANFSVDSSEVQSVSITGMEHAVAVDPAATPALIDQCGVVGQYAINPAGPASAGTTGSFGFGGTPAKPATQGLCSSYYTALFWGI